MTALTAADLAVHEALGITPDLLERQRVRRVDDREAREVLSLNGRPGRLDGILYPYIDPREQRIVTYRLRRDRPEIEHGKPKNKYLSAFGDRRHLYFASDELALSDITVPVINVEAEKSVLAITAAAARLGQQVLPVGLGGVYGWKGRIGKVETPNGGHADETGPLPDLDRITWTNRDSLIAFDSNASTNPQVQAARRSFARELTGRGARVRILDLPAEDGINGPDDFIGRYGDAAFFALFDAAPDACAFDVIFRLNQRHAVLREGGKTVVITEERDPALNRDIVTRTSFADFRNFYMSESVQVGVNQNTGDPIYKPLGHAWLAHPDRRQYEGMVLSPGREVSGYLNLWRGFALQPKAGTWSRFGDHIFKVICASNPAIFDYVMAWLAFGVQHPERQAEVALALRGPRGAGKGIFARAYGDLFGQHYLQVANTKHLTGNFNAHLQDTVVLFADEAFWAGDKAGESVLKMLVTEPVIPIERKGRDLITVPNLLHIIIASNHDWVVPAGIDERRFCVLDIDPAHLQDHDYFAAILSELNAGGRAAFLYDLLDHDLSAVNLRAVPATEALRQQKVLSLSPNERWLVDKLMSGRWLTDHQYWEVFILKDDLHEDYIQRLQRIGVERRSTETELGMFITKMLPDVKTERRTVNGTRRWGWAVPNLSDCRSAFDKATQSLHPWQDFDK